MFMYLHVSCDKEGRTRAQLKNDGELRTLGSSCSRATYAPVAVFRIDSFTGLDAVGTDDLLGELQRRFSATALMARVAGHLTNGELLDMVRRRMDM